MKRRLNKIFRTVVGWIYPNLCPACGGVLAEGEKAICTPCRWDMPLTGFQSEPLNPVFRFLHGEIPKLKQASALFYFHHDSQYRTAIHHLKYAGRRDLAQALGEWLGRELKDSGLYDDVTLLMPVPLHWTKRIKRGYNQAEEICIGMARSMGISADFRSLRRTRMTRTQALHRSKDARQRNVRDAFRIRAKRAEKLAGQHILLVDDVLTTGATVLACASAVQRAVPDVGISVSTLSVVKSVGQSQ